MQNETAAIAIFGAAMFIAIIAIVKILTAQETEADTTSTLPKEMRDMDADTMAALYSYDELHAVYLASGSRSPVLESAVQLSKAQRDLEREREKAAKPWIVFSEYVSAQMVMWCGRNVVNRFATKEEMYRWLSENEPENGSYVFTTQGPND